MIVGSPGYDGPGNTSLDSGNVFIYRVPPVDVPSVNSIDQVVDLVERRVEVGSEFVLDEGDRFGFSVSFAGPGDFIGDVGIDVFGQINGHALAVGAPSDDGVNNSDPGTGAVWLFAAPAFTGVDETGFENGAPVEFFDLLRFSESVATGSEISLSRNGSLLAIGNELDSLGTNDVRAGIGSVKLLSFGGSNGSSLSGNLLFRRFTCRHDDDHTE